jgi:dolichol-phosphate mannosyltransferase
MKKSVAIILPVYNEELMLLEKLILQIASQIPEGYIFIVDDSSNAKERKATLQKQIAHTKQYVKILARAKKMGRGDAVLAGFRQALKNKKVNFFIEMDSDFSHLPDDLSKFLEATNSKDTQVIIGSRYLAKSKIHNWPKKRIILSKIINKFLEYLLKLHVSDYTNGYRLYTRNAIEYLVKKRPKEKGFILLSESAFILKKANFSLKEIPITFTDRKSGRSSVTSKDLLLCLIGAFRIRLRYER